MTSLRQSPQSNSESSMGSRRRVLEDVAGFSILLSIVGPVAGTVNWLMEVAQESDSFNIHNAQCHLEAVGGEGTVLSVTNNPDWRGDYTTVVIEFSDGKRMKAFAGKNLPNTGDTWTVNVVRTPGWGMQYRLVNKI